VDKFGDIIPTGPKVIYPNMLNLTQNFEFWLPHIILSGDTQIFKLTFEAPPMTPVYWQNFTAIGRGSWEIWGLNGEKAVAPKFFWSDAPNFGTCVI